MPVQQAQYGNQPLGGYPGQTTYTDQQTPQSGQQHNQQQSFGSQPVAPPPQQSFQTPGYNHQQDSYRQETGPYPAGPQQMPGTGQPYSPQQGYPVQQTLKPSVASYPAPIPPQGNSTLNIFK